MYLIDVGVISRWVQLQGVKRLSWIKIGLFVFNQGSGEKCSRFSFDLIELNILTDVKNNDKFILCFFKASRKLSFF